MRKTFISIKRGMLEPKHREALGIRVWLYLYMIDIVDWDTGVIQSWKDRLASETLRMPQSTVTKQRLALEESGYITVNQSIQSLKITIHNWTNPREYSGEEYNKKVPKNGHPNVKENPKVGTHPPSKVGTPPYSPHINHILSLWKELFPNKPQPRATTRSFQTKVKARMKDAHFRDNWELALQRASQSPALQNEDWFHMEYFLRNDSNYEKCLNNVFSFKDKDYAPKPSSMDALSQRLYGSG